MVKIGTEINKKHGQRVVIYGPEGIGKTSLAAQFPNPLFIDTEGSTINYMVNRIEEGRAPSSWTELMNWLAFVKQNPTVCQTLVIDTIDWAERLCNLHVCSVHDKKGIEDFGWGNGYTYVAEEMGRLLDRLTDLKEMGINIVLTAHSQIRSFTQPDELGSYDRYELKLGQKTSSKTSALVKEWADMVLFINYKTVIVKDEKTNKGKGQGGQRVMYTTHTPAWDAKNRHGLPPELPLDYGSIAHVFNQGPQAQERAAEVVPPEPAKESAPVTPNPMPEVAQTRQEALQEALNSQPEIVPETSTQTLNEDLSALPQALQGLMVANNVTKAEIHQACGPTSLGGRGYFPEGTLIENYSKEFVDGVLIAAWPQVMAVIEENRKIPF